MGRCVQLRLLSHEVKFLERYAAQEEISVSRALGRVIDESAWLPLDTRRKSPSQVNRHLWLTDESLALLERLRARMGLSRSDVVRRILDGAIVAEGEARPSR